jgi:hypothetical protein
MFGVVLAVLALSQPAFSDNLDQAEREEKRLEADKSKLNKEIQLLEQENARQAKLVQEKLAKLAKLKAELADLQKRRDRLTVNLKAAEKGEQDAEREMGAIEDELKVTRSEVEKVTVKTSLAAAEYEQKRQAMLAKKADLMAQKALLKRRTDEYEANSKTAQEDMGNIQRDIARLNESSAPAKRKKVKRRPGSTARAKPSASDEFAPREDKSQRLFTIENN